ncbi:MAG: rhomboid family intramembrane serine protease [Planctomycetota bacterium]
MRKLKRRGELKELWGRVVQGEGSPGVACPICRRTTLDVAVPVEAQQVRLDVCKSCQFIWFDPKELEQLPSPPREMNDDERLPEEVREQMAMRDIQLDAQRERFKDISTVSGGGELTPDEPWQWIPGVLGLPVECGGNPVRVFPWVTWGLAAVLIAVFALTYGNLDSVIEAYGLIPARVGRNGFSTSLTSFFIHAGLLHLIGNVYFLVVFGDNVEEYLGRLRYVLLLLFATIAGDVAHVLCDPASSTPCVGASGGISGVIMFYALRFPRARLGILFRYFFFFRWFFMPAFGAMILWLLLQFLIAGLQITGATSVSGLAHLGGAAVGILAWLAWRAPCSAATYSRPNRSPLSG